MNPQKTAATLEQMTQLEQVAEGDVAAMEIILTTTKH